MTVAEAVLRLDELKELYGRLLEKRDNPFGSNDVTLSMDDLQECIVAVANNIRYIRRAQIEC